MFTPEKKFMEIPCSDNNARSALEQLLELHILKLLDFGNA